MSIQQDQDTYLRNLPQDISEYGLNKTLITRALSIDWKHRDTEIHLRSPDLLERVKLDFDLAELYSVRSHQLRYVYHISRSLFKNEDPNDLVYLFDFIKSKHFNTPLGNTFIDINCILKGGYTGSETIASSTVFSYNFMKQQDMIKYFITKNLPIPKQIISFTSFEDLNKIFSQNISFILFNHNTFSDNELLYLWLLNYHLYIPYRDAEGDFTYSRVSYKTDEPLQTPCYY